MQVKSKGEILQNFVAFSEYINFKQHLPIGPKALFERIDVGPNFLLWRHLSKVINYFTIGNVSKHGFDKGSEYGHYLSA